MNVHKKKAEYDFGGCELNFVEENMNLAVEAQGSVASGIDARKRVGI